MYVGGMRSIHHLGQFAYITAYQWRVPVGFPVIELPAYLIISIVHPPGSESYQACTWVACDRYTTWASLPTSQLINGESSLDFVGIELTWLIIQTRRTNVLPSPRIAYLGSLKTRCRRTLSANQTSSHETRLTRVMSTPRTRPSAHSR